MRMAFLLIKLQFIYCTSLDRGSLYTFVRLMCGTRKTSTGRK